MSDFYVGKSLPTLHEYDIVGYDLETIDPNLKTKGPGWPRRDGRVIGIAIGTPSGKRYYYPLCPETPGADQFPSPEETIEHFRNVFSRPSLAIVGANVGYDLGWSRTLGIEFAGPVYCVQAAEALLNENKATYRLESLAQEYLGEGKASEELEEEAARRGSIDKATGKGDPWPILDILPVALVGKYAAKDAWLTLKIHELQIEKFQGKFADCYQLERDIIQVVLDMTSRGVRVNEETILKNFEIIKEKLDAELFALKALVGRDVDIWSAEDIYEVAKQFNLPIGTPKRKKDSEVKNGKDFGFDADFLKENPNQIFNAILAARQYDRSGNVYLAEKTYGLAEDIGNGLRLYPTWRATRDGNKGTRTGRFSSENPCFQQFPSKNGSLAPLIRECYLPERGDLWLSADYCYSEDTEILTPTGFKKLSIVVEQRLPVYQIDDSFKITETTPIRYVKGEDVDWVSIKGKQQDILVTADHPILFFNKRMRRFSKCDFSEFVTTLKETACIVNAGYLSGANFVDIDLIKLTVAIQADGCIRASKKEGMTPSIRFKLKKEHKQDRLAKILESLSIPYTWGEMKSWEGFIYVSIKSDDIPSDCWSFLEKDYKTWNRSTLFSLSEHCRLEFLKELTYWDGSKITATNGLYFTSNEENANLIQELAICSGVRSNLAKNNLEKAQWSKKQAYAVSFSFEKTMTYVKNSNFLRIRENLPKQSYCVTVQTGKIILRRNGKVFIGSNCAQEPRLTTHYGALLEDKSAISVANKYKEDPRTDYHQLVADMIKEVCDRETERKDAKTINLAIAYGAGKKKIAEELGLGQQESYKLIEAYYEALPYIAKLQKMTQQKAESTGFITTLLGRRRNFNLYGLSYWEMEKEKKKLYEEGVEIPKGHFAPKFYDEAAEKWGQKRIQQWSTYKALNALIQGSAADQTKKAMVDCWKAGIKILGTIHDELCFSVSSEEEAREAIRLMETAVELHVPMVVDAEIGPNWGSLKEFV